MIYLILEPNALYIKIYLSFKRFISDCIVYLKNIVLV